jgi:chromosome segregation ATPase
VNAARKLTYGKLAELAHTQPAGTMPAAFAERFFLHDTSGRAASTSEVERTIGRLQIKLARHQGVLAELNAKQAAAQKSKHDAALAEKQSKLADAQKKAADAASELAALEAEVAKG